MTNGIHSHRKKGPFEVISTNILFSQSKFNFTSESIEFGNKHENYYV